MRYSRLIAIIMMSIVVSGVPFGISAQTDDAILFEEQTIRYDGRNRLFLMYVPPQYDDITPLPLVFVLHGGGGNPYMYDEMTEFGQKARDEGFILVYPAGTGRLPRQLLTWNSGYCCGYALEQDVDDVGFFRALVASLTSEYVIDSARIYVAGHSNGGMMAYRLGAEMSDVFAAVGVMAGTIGGYPTPDSDNLYIIPQPENPVSIIHIHGLEDENVRYEGGENADNTFSKRNDLSVADAISFWVNANRCAISPISESWDDGMVLVDTYACDETNTAIKLISIVDGGHSWAGGLVNRRRADLPSNRVSATDEMWSFFESHPKP